jgi:hypothetical protein
MHSSNFRQSRPPSASAPLQLRRSPFFFLSSLFFTSLLGARLTLESLVFRAQLLEVGLDGCELSSGLLQPTTRPSAFSCHARHLSARTRVSSKRREASASSASFWMHHPLPPVPIPLPHPVPCRSLMLPTHASSCVSRTTHRMWGTHTPSEHPPWEVFLHRYGCIMQCASLIHSSPSEWHGADDIFLVSFVL